MKSLLLALALFASAVSAVQFQECGTTVKNVQYKISGCSDADDACPFVIGSNVTLEAAFEAASQINSATIKLFGKLGPIPVPFKINPDNACGNWGMVCPASPGTTENLKISLPIQSYYKPMRVGVRLELWDGKSKLICTQFPAKIVKA